ncbi:MAG: HAD-IA family hydrolase [Defluviitaleaceae bacterium]|nr:HAD-IA family hydrolase [Defluviitaleaceae bacterium]MCL2273704.1 HAD-IA family hydrolase [Defluviitaleaceae bacterium]
MLEIICINCPAGCLMTVNEAGEATGHLCAKGLTYANEERTNPTRNITTSVRVRGGTLSMLSVKTASPIPKGEIFNVTREIHKITLNAPIRLGEVVLENAANTGVPIVATRHIPRRAYIFDLDGTILDSATLWNGINRAFFEKRGIPFPMDYQRVIGAMPFPQVAQYTRDTYNLPETPEELMKEFLQMATHGYTHEIKMKAGAKAYLQRLRENGHKMAVATAAPPQLFTPALKNHGIYDLFDAICTTADVGVGKIEPDVFLLAAKKLGALPADCIVFDDIPAAVKSAKGAGFLVCGLYDNQADKEWAEIVKTADYTLQDFTALYF